MSLIVLGEAFLGMPLDAVGIVADVNGVFLVFFFSSRRRHTRFDCDWSSDVCSSDLDAVVLQRRDVDPNSGAQMATVVPISGATLNADDIAALQNDSVTRFRYDLTNVNDKFAAGDLTVSFAGTWKDSFGNTPGTGSVSVHIAGPTAAVVSPAGGSGIDINTVNGRTYIDVTIPDPPAGFQIDWDAMAQRTPVFTLSGPGVGSAKVDTSQAPLVDSVAKSLRYWITGAFTTV